MKPYRLVAWICASFAWTGIASAEIEAPVNVLGGLKLLPVVNVHVLQPAARVRELPLSTNQELVRKVNSPAMSYLRQAMSVLLVEEGAILFEGYARGMGPETKFEAYSMTKSWVALAVGEALCAGKIRSLDDLAADYVPELQGTAQGSASIRQLLGYTSGAKHPGGNGYEGIHSKVDYYKLFDQQLSLLDLLKKYGEPGRQKPGEKFIYNGLDSGALSLVVRAATGVPLPVWFEQTVWQEAGGEHKAGWFLDKDGNGVGDIRVYASTRDFARVGLYVLERLNGRAGEACIQTYVREAASPRVRKGYWWDYPQWGYGLHVGTDGNPWMLGLGGQRVGMNPSLGRVYATNGVTETRDSVPESFRLLAIR